MVKIVMTTESGFTAEVGNEFTSEKAAKEYIKWAKKTDKQHGQKINYNLILKDS